MIKEKPRGRGGRWLVGGGYPEIRRARNNGYFLHLALNDDQKQIESKKSYLSNYARSHRCINLYVIYNCKSTQRIEFIRYFG